MLSKYSSLNMRHYTSCSVKMDKIPTPRFSRVIREELVKNPLPIEMFQHYGNLYYHNIYKKKVEAEERKRKLEKGAEKSFIPEKVRKFEIESAEDPEERHESDTDETSVDFNGKRKHTCSQCRKQYTSKSYLKDHILTHIGEKQFPCTVCDKTFYSDMRLKWHLRVHSSNLQRTCPTCSKVFKSERNLNTHLVIHSNARPFKCSLCLRSFKRKDVLDQHVKLHEGKGDHVCPVCGQIFVRPGDLRRHQSRFGNTCLNKRKRVTFIDFTSNRQVSSHIPYPALTAEQSKLATDCQKALRAQQKHNPLQFEDPEFGDVFYKDTDGCIKMKKNQKLATVRDLGRILLVPLEGQTFGSLFATVSPGWSHLVRRFKDSLNPKDCDKGVCASIRENIVQKNAKYDFARGFTLMHFTGYVGRQLKRTGVQTHHNGNKGQGGYTEFEDKAMELFFEKFQEESVPLRPSGENRLYQLRDRIVNTRN